jgi:diguanylate cyclase (GGDEF)-like protein
MLVAGLSVLITSAIFSAYELDRMRESENVRLHSIAGMLESHLTAAILFDDTVTAKELILPLLLQPNIVNVEVLDKNNVSFYSTQSSDQSQDDSRIADKVISSHLTLDDTYYGKLVIYADNGAEEEHTKAYISFLIGILIIILSSSLIVSIWLGKKFVKPIVLLAETASQITSTNNYSIRADSDSHDELGKLTDCFNDMLDTIEQRDHTLERAVNQRTEQLEVANKKLKSQAYIDSLSGLPNRRYILEMINRMTLEEETPFSVLFVDLDGFKEVNDTMGHDFGDSLIVCVSERIKHTIRSKDTIARLGGDEFTVILDGLVNHEDLHQVAMKILQELNKPYSINGEVINISGSVGISSYPERGKNTEELMKNADMAMYEAKAAGRNCYRFFEPSMHRRALKKRRLLNDLRTCISDEQLETYVQPIINTKTGVIEKAELLLRWNHPVRGTIYPEEFIPVAEDNGLINDIGLWVAKQAIELTKHVRCHYSEEFCVSFNVSPIQLKKDSPWVRRFIDLVVDARLDDNALLIEITENSLIDSEASSLNQLLSMKNLGVNVAIDDFGVGYSSLSYLQRLEVDMLKIDKSFICNIASDESSATLCHTMINLAKNLDIVVVAEGVEKKEQMEKLQMFGCDYVQGFYFYHPLSTTSFETLLKEKFQASTLSNTKKLTS